jgi:cell division protein FtsW (lipid II flippase)
LRIAITELLRKNTLFCCIFLGTLLLCSGILIYAHFNATALAETHNDPQFFWQQIQLVVSGVLAIVVLGFMLYKSLYKRQKIGNVIVWFAIPTILTVFSFLYMLTVVSCPICGSLG